MNESMKDRAVEQDNRERAELEKLRKEAYEKRVQEQGEKQAKFSASRAERRLKHSMRRANRLEKPAKPPPVFSISARAVGAR